MSTTSTNQPQSNSQLNQSTTGNTSLMEDESIYVLPKTYNGKTVTELFPEFKYDSVIEKLSKIK